MKPLQIIGLCLGLTLLSFPLKAQIYIFQEEHNFPDNPRKIYLGVGIGHGYYNRLVNIHASFIAKNHWGINLAYRSNIRIKAKDLPQNYETGICFFNCRPNDYVKTVSLNLVRDFPLSTSSVSIEFGPALVFYQKANFSRNRLSGLLGRNYTLYYTLQSSLGLPIRISTTYPSARFISTQLAAIINLNKLNSFFGLEINFLMGALGN